MGQWHGLQTAESALLAAVDPAHRDNTSQVNLARLQTKINGRWWSPEELSYRPANICTSADRGLVEFSRLLSNSSSVNGKALGIGFLQGEGRLSLILDILMWTLPGKTGVQSNIVWNTSDSLGLSEIDSDLSEIFPRKDQSKNKRRKERKACRL